MIPNLTRIYYHMFEVKWNQQAIRDIQVLESLILGFRQLNFGCVSCPQRQEFEQGLRDMRSCDENECPRKRTAAVDVTGTEPFKEIEDPWFVGIFYYWGCRVLQHSQGFFLLETEFWLNGKYKPLHGLIAKDPLFQD